MVQRVGLGGGRWDGCSCSLLEGGGLGIRDEGLWMGRGLGMEATGGEEGFCSDIVMQSSLPPFYERRLLAGGWGVS